MVPDVVKAAFELYQNIDKQTKGMSAAQHSAWLDKNDPIPAFDTLDIKADAEGLELGDCTAEGQKWRRRGERRWKLYAGA